MRPGDLILMDRLRRQLSKIFIDELERISPEGEAVLKKVREVYQLYEFARVGYIKLAKEGRILSANLAAAYQMKTPRSEVVGKSIYSFIKRRDRDKLYLHLRQLFKYKKPKTCELQLEDPKGRREWVRLNSFYSQMQPEDISQSLTAMVDIDEEKQARAKP